jgi:hypothetical protein
VPGGRDPTASYGDQGSVRRSGQSAEVLSGEDVIAAAIAVSIPTVSAIPYAVERRFPRGGTGLQGMADRLEAVGGRLEVSSAPGRGTTVRGSVPVSAAVAQV